VRHRGDAHPRARGRRAQPALNAAGLGHDVIDQLDGQVAGQLAEMAGANTPAATTVTCPAA
jgi:hypothetical protein